MVKTAEIYYEDAYLREFEARVLSCEEGKDGNFFVVLDRTAFFPEQGGQSSDVGTMTDDGGNTVKIIHTSIEDGVITHVADGALSIGSSVRGMIDWEHRFSNMQQHTGEHIFSGIVNSKFGYDNVGFHLSDNEVTMDYSGPLTEDSVRELETEVNCAIWADIEVKCEFPSAEELKELDYRSKKELSGDIRIVTIPGYDVCACCAPHVRRTGEIGILKVLSCQSYKGGSRVSILCGRRALEFVRERQSIVEELVSIFTTGTDKITASVRKLSDENYTLKGRIRELSEKLMDYELSQIDESLVDVFLVKEDGFDGNLMRKMVTSLASVHSGYCGIFSGSDDSGYKYIVTTGSARKDLKALQKELGDRFSAKGGGKSDMIQGSIRGAAIADIIAACRGIHQDA